jgi:5-methylcytosine-specific restriction enzyme subunit McrC
MKHVGVAENGRVELQLTSEQGRMLAASSIVTASPLPHNPGMWRIKPRSGLVGVAQVGDMEVWIEPKLPIARLLFLAGYANGKKPLDWRDDNVTLDVAEGLVPVVARLLCHQAEQALGQGPLKGYRTVEESSAVLRGRLREADQLRRHHGRAIPMEIRHDDFTIDVPENQIVLAAITRMAGVPRVRDEYRRRLAALRAILADVSTPERGASLPSWHPNRLNQRYHAVLRLAEVIWQATSPEHVPGSLVANGFLFNLWKIFEDFLVVALSEELQARHGGVPRSYPCHLDQACAVEMKPDLVWQVNGQPVAVVDAKYKPEKPSGYPYADLYQVLAYCTALHLPRGHLVYARGNADPVRHVVRYSGIEIVCHALDLTLPPAKLLAQVGDIADELVTPSRLLPT